MTDITAPLAVPGSGCGLPTRPAPYVASPVFGPTQAGLLRCAGSVLRKQRLSDLWIIDGMNRGAKYRRHAADCFAMAQHVTNPHLKATMLGMAASWSTLAEHAQQRADFGFEHGPPPEADDQVQ
jgi:hypothetical protein